MEENDQNLALLKSIDKKLGTLLYNVIELKLNYCSAQSQTRRMYISNNDVQDRYISVLALLSVISMSIAVGIVLYKTSASPLVLIGIFVLTNLAYAVMILQLYLSRPDSRRIKETIKVEEEYIKDLFKRVDQELHDLSGQIR